MFVYIIGSTIRKDMNTDMFSLDSHIRHSTMNDATGTDFISEKYGHRICSTAGSLPETKPSSVPAANPIKNPSVIREKVKIRF